MTEFRVMIYSKLRGFNSGTDVCDMSTWCVYHHGISSDDDRWVWHMSVTYERDIWAWHMSVRLYLTLLSISICTHTHINMHTHTHQYVHTERVPPPLIRWHIWAWRHTSRSYLYQYAHTHTSICSHRKDSSSIYTMTHMSVTPYLTLLSTWIETTYFRWWARIFDDGFWESATHCNTLQHTATQRKCHTFKESTGAVLQTYGVAMISRLPKNIGLFCRI